MKHRGRAVVFETSDQMHTGVEDDSLDVSADDILVLKNCGPKGYPGMAEVGNMPLPAKLLRQGVTDMVRISDARMSGTAYGTVVLHAAPEAAAGGNLALVKTGDIIELDVERRRLQVSDEELKRAARRGKLRISDVARIHQAVLRSRAAGRQGRRPRLSGRRQRVGGSEGQPLNTMRALITDYDFPDIELEREVFRTGGVEHVVAQCRTEDDLIAAARECDALLLQYAPVTDRVLAALPRIGLVSRYGADSTRSIPKRVAATACGWPIRRTTESARWRHTRSR